MTGQQAFVSINMRHLQYAEATVSTAPALDNWPSVAGPAVVDAEETPLLALSVTGPVIGLTEAFEVWASGPLSAGISFIRPTLYRFMDFVQNVTDPSVDITTVWEAQFGTMAAIEGSKISLRYRGVITNRIAGPWSRADGIVIP
jgi:hypothetical protein